MILKVTQGSFGCLFLFHEIASESANRKIFPLRTRLMKSNLKVHFQFSDPADLALAVKIFYLTLTADRIQRQGQGQGQGSFFDPLQLLFC